MSILHPVRFHRVESHASVPEGVLVVKARLAANDGMWVWRFVDRNWVTIEGGFVPTEARAKAKARQALVKYRMEKK